MVIPSNDRAYRRGAAEPSQVLVDDGFDVRTVRAPSSIGRSVRKTRPRPAIQLARRASSYDGDRYSRRKSVARSPTRSYNPTTSGRRSSVQPRHTVKTLPSTKTTVREQPSTRTYVKELPPTRTYVRELPSTTTSSKPRSTIWSSLLPPSRNSRSRTVTYEKPRAYSRSPPRRRYASTRTSEPDIVERSSRPRRGTSRVVETRRGSLDVDDRMRLLAIRDKFRDEVDRARRWQEPPIRYRDYDRRLVR
jgi:hypothetical protein